MVKTNPQLLASYPSVDIDSIRLAYLLPLPYLIAVSLPHKGASVPDPIYLTGGLDPYHNKDLITTLDSALPTGNLFSLLVHHPNSPNPTNKPPLSRPHNAKFRIFSTVIDILRIPHPRVWNIVLIDTCSNGCLPTGRDFSSNRQHVASFTPSSDHPCKF